MRKVAFFKKAEKEVIEQKKEEVKDNKDLEIENLKSSVRKTAVGLYHENIISSFTSNLDEVIGRRVKNVQDSVEESTDSIQKTIKIIDEIFDMVRKMDEMAKSNLDQIIESNKNVRTQLQEAGTSLDALDKDIVETINATTQSLSEFSKISKMADAILDIAHETSILSLNASIEAARAGEAGKGFAVVATEIQNLSAETDRTSKEISKLVTDLSQKVELSMKSIQKMTIFKALKSSLDNIMKVLNENERFIMNVRSRTGEIANAVDKGMGELEDTKARIEELLKIVITVRDVIDNVLKVQQLLKEIQI
mgnify:CR=1 FL=1